MKASELIAELQKQIAEHGDIEVYRTHAIFETAPLYSIEVETVRDDINPHKITLEKKVIVLS